MAYSMQHVPPAVVAVQGAANVLSALVQGLASVKRSTKPCKPCEKKRRMEEQQRRLQGR